MTDPHLPPSAFLHDLTSTIQKNISNEQFGVSELADQMNMSRSNLLRKVKKETNLSVSQLISQIRLQRAMELLRNTSQNVSEVSHQVGFNSTSYFIKCFREHYGYPPGEVGKREMATPATDNPVVIPSPSPGPRKSVKPFIWTAAVVLAVAVVLILFWPRNTLSGAVEKSIAVLPFKNDSNDSTNVYLINGLMEATLNNLQQIKDVRVISRTSAEKYRNTTKSIPEMASELNVKYFVEGSGQKLDGRILLNIQLIDAESDKHLWAKQYRREAKDIFDLQKEIAQDIASEIEIILTPEEKDLIEKKPTDDLQAYDYYLKGKDLFYRSRRPEMEASIPWFKKAIERDPEFALAYATATMVFYYLDIFNQKPQYASDIDDFAERALLADPRLSESHIAKALSFASKKQYTLAVPYLERALEYDPRSPLVFHFLTEFYTLHIPHPPKYLEYAIRKLQVDNSADSATLSFNYFQVSNALVQNGFFEEGLKYSTKSLQLNPKNFFAGYARAYIYYATDRSCKRTKELLFQEWKKDTMRFDILQEIGKVSHLMGDFTAARSCYDRAIPIMEMYSMDIFKPESLRIADTYTRTGNTEKARHYTSEFKKFADQDPTMYKDLHKAIYLSYLGDNTGAMTLFKKFALEQDNFLYWILLLPDDPLCANLIKHPDFKSSMSLIETKFWNKHRQMKERWEADFTKL